MIESTIGALEIATTLLLPPPTEQQRRVIEADPDAPALVIAGAGSGKTETMANRVLWLIANRFIAPSEILGLTFTRKAAGELSARVRKRIGQLIAAGLADRTDELDLPQISTYNSYANVLYRDNASALGRESDARVLGPAAAWQLARTIVIKSPDVRLLDQERSLDQITEAVLLISRALADNVADAHAVRRYAQDFASVLDLPLGSAFEYGWVTEIVETVAELDLLLGLAAEYDAAKVFRGLVEYSDQVALALAIVRSDPSVALHERSAHQVVLLDEYQDTSVTQTLLLSELYREHAVMAVGDPNQSIYGWRGASASNLEQFDTQFGAANRFSLSMSWRNGTRILDAANVIVSPFAATHGVELARLEPKPLATEREIDVEFVETIALEAKAVAKWFESQLAQGGKSAAMLMRARRTQPVFLAALREQGVKYHVLGLGGLLTEPEVADVVCALTVVHSADAGIELMRLLAGAHWRMGVSDLHELGELASTLAKRGIDERLLPPDVRDRLRASVAEGDRGSIVDALDFISTARPGRSELEAFTPTGVERLRDAGRLFARLRARSRLPLPEFVGAVVHELQLDIEVGANPFRTLGSAPLDALLDALASYLEVEDVASLGGFLSWLREAEKREDLTPRPEDPEPGTVQVLTIHGAKGLEWDVVAVPRLVHDELPAMTQGVKGWMRYGQLPWEFRGDADDLPHFPWRSVESRKQFVDEEKRFEIEVREHEQAEERRLAYVAVTRAKESLLLSGSFWAATKKPRPPSIFLQELAEASVIGELPHDPESVENPHGDEVEMISWPLDPLGERRPSVESAAVRVREADAAILGPWQHEIELLLEERARRLDARTLVDMPTRVPASRFKDYVNDPASVAAGLRRPLPEKPYRATQLGTLFHSWVENRFGLGGDAEALDSTEIELDVGDSISTAELDALKAIFEASPWATLKPAEVEREIHLPFDGRIVICKIDAVFPVGGDRFEIVDWKTGKAPKDAADLEEKQLQLALYRLAYAKWRNIDPDRIDAVFFYVAQNLVVRPEHIFGEQELLARWRGALKKS